MSFATQIEKLQTLLEEFCRAGMDLTAVRAEMREIEALMDRGDFRAAEQRLSRLVTELRQKTRRLAM